MYTYPYKAPCRYPPGQRAKQVGTWRSLVARILGVDEAAGSNPVVPTNFLVLPGLRGSSGVSVNEHPRRCCCQG